jgi:hypothetical protein
MTQTIRDAIPQLERTVEVLEELMKTTPDLESQCFRAKTDTELVLIRLRHRLQRNELTQLKSWKAEVIDV